MYLKLCARTVPALLVLVALAGCVGGGEDDATTRLLPGGTAPLGDGEVESFAAVAPDGAPLALGLRIPDAALSSLPTEPTDGHRCHDSDGDGEIDEASECSAWHERVVPLPTEVARRDDVPFGWVLLNWNNHGHIPPGVWDVPHFDVHFYIAPIEDVFALERGPCGPEFLRCDQFEAATRPVPANYMHPEYVDVGAAAPAMGNHLVDTTAAEFHGEPFTRSWIYGVYDGEVTFYEEMVALDYLRTRPDRCFPIKTTPAVGVTGYYPTEACTRYDPDSARTSISIESFQYREATPPAGS